MTKGVANKDNNAGLKKYKIGWFWQKYSYLESSFVISVEDFVKIVKQAGSIKRNPMEKNWKIVKRAAC